MSKPYISLLIPDDLCRPLICKKKEICLLEDAYTAVCVSKKELHRNRYVQLHTTTHTLIPF